MFGQFLLINCPQELSVGSTPHCSFSNVLNRRCEMISHHSVTMKKIPSACGGVSILQRRPDQERTPQNLSGVDGDVYVPLYGAPFTAAVVSIMTSCNTLLTERSNVDLVK